MPLPAPLALGTACIWRGLQSSEATCGPERQTCRTFHKLLLLNDSRLSFSTKQGHKWLAGILLTEVWASDSRPPRPGTEQELEASWGAQSSVRSTRQRPCLLPACLCEDRQTHRLTGIQRCTNTLSHLNTLADTHSQTYRLTQAHRDPQTDTQIHTGTPRHTGIHRHIDSHRFTQRHTHTDTDSQRHTKTNTLLQAHRDTYTQTHRQTHRYTQTHRLT